MNYRTNALMLLALLLLLASNPRGAQAAESYDNCTNTVASVPAVISTQGTWCLKQDLSTSITSGKAITIAADNVTLDCNDFKLDGLAAGNGTRAIGVFADTRLNATVRNCNIRGFDFGVYLTGSNGGGHTVEDNRFDGNTYVAIDVQSDGSVIRRNRLFDTGGSSVQTSTFGVVAANSVDVIDNSISGVMARSGSSGSVYGIYTSANPNGSINNNRVRGLAPDGTGLALAINNTGSDRVTIRNNDLVGTGLAGSVGIHCANSHGRIKQNVINGFAKAIDLCSNDDGNVIAP